MNNTDGCEVAQPECAEVAQRYNGLFQGSDEQLQARIRRVGELFGIFGGVSGGAAASPEGGVPGGCGVSGAADRVALEALCNSDMAQYGLVNVLEMMRRGGG